MKWRWPATVNGWRMMVIVVTFGLCVVGATLMRSPAFANSSDPDPSPTPNPSPSPSASASSTETERGPEIWVTIEERKRQSNEANQTVSTVPSGTYRYAPACELGGEISCHSDAKCADGSDMLIRLFTPTNGTEYYAGSVCPSEVEPTQAPRITMGMVLRALKRVRLPEPKIVIQPPGGRTLVNFDTLFRTEAGALQRSVRLLGHRVSLDISPVRYVWHHGDDTSQATTDPGVAYAKGVPTSAYVSHQYTDAHVTVHPSVDVVYEARFRVDGGEWRDVIGTVSVAGPDSDLRIIEGRPTLLAGP